MPIERPTALDLPESSIPFLRGVEDGFHVDIRTPLFDGRDRQEVAEQWLNILQKHVMHMAYEVEEMELGQYAKIGPISRRLPFRDRIQDVEAYYNPRPQPKYDYTELVRMEGGESTRALKCNEGPSTPRFPEERLRPISHYDAACQLPGNTNSGEPRFARRESVLRQSVTDAIHGRNYPAMCGWRGSSGQTGDEYGKQRVVWMVSFVTNIREARYQIVMQPFYVAQPQYFAALISMEAVDLEVTHILDHVPGDGYVIGTDYTKYDQTNRTQQEWFFRDARNMFQRRYQSELSEIQNIVRTMELVCTTDIKFVGEHGWPSGSNFTLMANSHINRLVQMSSPVVIGSRFQVQGDDGCGRVFDVDRHLHHLENCGFDANPDKQFVSRRCTMYLQRMHHLDHRSTDGICHGIYPTMRALNSLLGQERFHRNWDKKMEALRTLAILNNTQWHPLFKEFCNFTVKFGDKYVKEFADSLEDVNFRRSVLRQVRTIPGFMPSYNLLGDISGICSFASTHYIRSL